MELESHKKQKINDGYGATFHRIYSIEIAAHPDLAMQVMEEIQKDPNGCTPRILAHFEKVKGEPGTLTVGDEFQIHITGPWNGPVRVIEVDPTGFRLETLEGHLEAGEIRFQVKPKEDSAVFEIESLARSRDAVVDLVYDKIPIAKIAQTEMWIAFCKRFALNTLSHLRSVSEDEVIAMEVKVTTERCDEETGQWKAL